MNTSGFIAIVVALGLGFLGGYKYATRLVDDQGPLKPRIIEKQTPAVPPDPRKIQTPDVRITHPVIDPDTVCLAADAAFTLRGLSGYGLEGGERGRGALRAYFPAVTYVDPATDRLAVTRTRSGALRVPYTYRGRTRVDEFRFVRPGWDLFVEVEAALAWDAFPALRPQRLDVRGMGWIRVGRWHVGAGGLAGIDNLDGSALLLGVTAVRWRPFSLRN